MNYIDLFAGAGGLSEGFRRQGFDAVAHVEMNSNACMTLKTRACYQYLQEHGQIGQYYQYLRGLMTREQLYANVPNEVTESVINVEISPETITGIFDTIDRRIEQHPEWNGHVDLIIGGPPCQAYSMMGRAAKSAKDRDLTPEEIIEDPRNFLYKMYCRFLRKYHPDMFVFENVPGILTAGKGKYFANIKKYFRTLGYEVQHRELNSSCYGVLQNRKRIIIVGWQRELNHHYPELEEIEHDYTVNDILNDLPKLVPGQVGNGYRRTGQLSPYLQQFHIREIGDVLTQHEARPQLDRDRRIYRKMIRAWNSDHTYMKYNDLPRSLKVYKETKNFADRFKIVEGDMPACHTMIAHIAKDGHYFIHPDISQARSITVREAARIQSFPDNYYFEGGRTAAFTQIGNAVPPLLAEAIARGILQQFQEEE